MKFSAPAIFFAVLAPLAVTAQEPTVLGRDVHIEKRAVGATVRVDGLRYRTCPKTSCAAPGQFPIGKKISLQCYTRTGTTTVKGDKGWAKIASGTGKGNWVALAWGEYVTWNSDLPHC